MGEELENYLLASQHIVMYSDLNSAGRLFGGRLLAWIDEGTAMTAMRLMKTRSVVTKKFGEVVFDAPGKLGDLVEIWCHPEREGTSSLTLDARALVRTIRPEKVQQICHSTVVYVALDAAGRPRPWRQPS